MEAEKIAAPSTQPSKAPRITGAQRVEAEQQFLSQLRVIQPSSVVFSSLEPTVCEPVLQTNGSQSVTRKLPHPLTSLHKHEYKKLEKGELEALCEEKFAKGIMLITHDEAAYLEESTRLQAQSLLWFEHRIGHLTASKFLAVSQASLDPPPASLVKEIMVRSNRSGFVPALQWGTGNEDKAREAYVELASEEHENVRFMPAGLHVESLLSSSWSHTRWTDLL